MSSSMRECTMPYAANTEANPLKLVSAKEQGMVTKKQLILFGSSFCFFTACNLVLLPPSPTRIAGQVTGTLYVTNTLQPTTVFLPTSTAIPVFPTPTFPLPGVLTQYLDNVQIVKVDTFEDPSAWNATHEISNGTLLLVGSGNDWHGLSNDAVFQEGAGVVINFKFTRGEFFEMYFERGPWNTSLYKRFGVYMNGGHSSVNLFIGKEGRGSGRIAGNLSLHPDTWYSLFMVVGKGGDFLALLWDPANPGNSLRYREVIKNWRELGWTFRMQVNQGTITFDDFEQIEFDGIK